MATAIIRHHQAPETLVSAAILTRRTAGSAVWTAAQTAQFPTAIARHRLYAPYHLVALRGLRRGEAAGLRWCDTDPDNATTAVISQQLQQNGGRMEVTAPKDCLQCPRDGAGPHHRRGAARPPPPPARRGRRVRGRLPGQRLCVHELLGAGRWRLIG
jgi:integrase